MSKRYKITVLEFDGEGESLSAQELYNQTTPTLDLRGVIAAVNREPSSGGILPALAPRKRAPRSDRGKPRKPQAAVGFQSAPVAT